jgi:hypothetical protein
VRYPFALFLESSGADRGIRRSLEAWVACNGYAVARVRVGPLWRGRRGTDECDGSREGEAEAVKLARPCSSTLSQSVSEVRVEVFNFCFRVDGTIQDDSMIHTS